MSRSRLSIAATGDAVEDASAVKPGRRGVDGVAMRHPARLLVGQPGEQPTRLADREVRAAELADLRALDLRPEPERDELHPVADAQHRNAELEQLLVQPRRARRVHRGGPAGEDQPLRLALADLLGADVVRQQLAEDAQLAHAARDELRVLPAVVEHDDLVDPARRVDVEDVLLDELGRGVRRGDEAVGHDVSPPSGPAPCGRRCRWSAPARRRWPTRGRPSRRPARPAAACPRSAAPARS